MTLQSESSAVRSGRSALNRPMPLVVGMVFLLVCMVFTLTPAGLSLERALGLKWLFDVRGAIDPPSNVFVVGMDSESAQLLNQPTQLRRWDRSLHADLIDRLVDYGVAVIAFDVFFQTERSAAEDARLWQSIQSSKRTILGQTIDRIESAGMVTSTVVKPAGNFASAPIALAPFPLPVDNNRVDRIWLFHSDTGDTPTLPMAALQVMAINLVGYNHFTELLSRAEIIDEGELPDSMDRAVSTQFVLSNLSSAFRKNPAALEKFVEVIHQEGTNLSTLSVRVLKALGNAYTRNSGSYLNFYGPPQSVTTIPYHLIWHDDIPARLKDQLRNSAVFVGSSSTLPSSQLDGFLTVFSTNRGLDIAGVEIAATALGNLLDSNAIRPIEFSFALIVIASFGVVAWFLILSAPGLRGVCYIAILGICYVVLAELIFSSTQILMPVAIPLLIQIPITVLAGLFLHYSRAKQAREFITEAMGFYVPREVVDQLGEDSELPGSDSETIEACCLCSDVEGYTTLSERISEIELHDLTNEYFSHVGECIGDSGGSVMNYVGDGATCIWRVDGQEKQIRHKACLAALDILDRVEGFNQQHPGKKFPTRIGLHIGNVVIGDTGGGGHFNYGIKGNTVNTASRIEQLNKQLGTRLLATEAVVRGLDNILFRPLGQFVLKGKFEQLGIVEIIARLDHVTTAQLELCRSFSIALESYESLRWPLAHKEFESLLLDFPNDGPSTFYCEHIKRYHSKPAVSNNSSAVVLEFK